MSCRRVHHGYDLTTWRVIAAAVERGHDFRIGLEDTLLLPDGRLARDNLELIQAARSVLERAV
ncbi:MAG: 3-keto-5-aminohexanoate cleavage protein [Candidatus Dormibacter sp.]|uniref:3-keto-5-aminohexanoate cleavage protein n=1 Tax=Candidatus Dormibacter sp. TaxID=2973982 RepID=UPI003D9B625B